MLVQMFFQIVQKSIAIEEMYKSKDKICQKWLQFQPKIWTISI